MLHKYCQNMGKIAGSAAHWTGHCQTEEEVALELMTQLQEHGHPDKPPALGPMGKAAIAKRCSPPGDRFLNTEGTADRLRTSSLRLLQAASSREDGIYNVTRKQDALVRAPSLPWPVPRGCSYTCYGSTIGCSRTGDNTATQQ